MEYERTAERNAYLNARRFTILTACPGSGKTTSIVMKLRDVSEYCKEQYGRHTGFACLSFTNKACEELKCKYRCLHDERLSFPDEVATIDSFILQKVVQPFWYLCTACKNRPLVVNENEQLGRVYYTNVQINGCWKQFPVAAFKPYQDIIHRKEPSHVSIDSIGRRAYRWNHSKVTDSREIAYCEAVFDYRLKNGFITSCDALWIACDIMDRHQEVAKALVSRYPYMIVDEAQDNSELHFAFFDRLRHAGLQNLEFVGDICQSIYRFNGARPELLQRKMESGEWNVLPLSECRRSNQRIIDLYSKLKSRDVLRIKSHGVDDRNIPIVVYKYDEGNVRSVINDFNRTCDDNGLNLRIVLARGVNKCKQLAGVEDLGFKYWKSELPYLLIDAMFAARRGDLSVAFRKVRLILAELKGGDKLDSRRKYVQEIERDVEMDAKIYTFLGKVPSLSLSFKDWSKQTAELMRQQWELKELPDFVPFKRKSGYVMRDMAEVPVERYCLSTDRESEYHNGVSTIHAAKGASFDGVLLFLSKDSKGQNISLKDFPQEEVDSMTENQSLIYVACSRARHFLALAVPVEVCDVQVRQVLSGVDIDIRRMDDQRCSM